MKAKLKDLKPNTSCYIPNLGMVVYISQGEGRTKHYSVVRFNGLNRTIYYTEDVDYNRLGKKA